MRALIVSLTLLVSVVFCVAFLVFVMGMRPGTPVLVSLGLGLFMLAALFAALSALGPKFRPTPMLTPTMAGTLAAALATVLVIVGNAQQPPRQQLAAPAVTPPTQSEMVPRNMPNIAVAPQVRLVDTPAAASVPPLADTSRSLADLLPSDPSDGPESTATGPALLSTILEEATGAPAEPATTNAAEPVVPPSTNSAEVAPPQALSLLPEPADSLAFNDGSFDTSGAGAGPNLATASTPPLPRSRPCGVAGLPCP
jgi:hypothetical protein